MERPVFKPIGTPSEELDTPALVVDLGAVESNITTVHRRVQDAGSRVRPRLDAHLCPAIGHMQVGAGGTSGVAVSTVGQAEVFSQHGFDDILIANVAVTPSKIARVASLAKRITLTVGTDSARNIDDLSEAAVSLDTRFGVAVSIRGCGDSIGASPRDAPDLAYRIQDKAPNLRFAGLFEAPSRKMGLNSAETTDERLDSLSEAEFKCTSQCIPPPMVAAGRLTRSARRPPSICPGAGPGVSRSVAPWPDCAPCHSQPDSGRLQPARQPHPPATPTSPKLAPDRPQTGQ